MERHRHKLLFASGKALLLTLTVMVSALRADTKACTGAGLTIPFMDVSGSTG